MSNFLFKYITYSAKLCRPNGPARRGIPILPDGCSNFSASRGILFCQIMQLLFQNLFNQIEPQDGSKHRGYDDLTRSCLICQPNGPAAPRI